jgi:GNAT superfamily N-acetyltransferase
MIGALSRALVKFRPATPFDAWALTAIQVEAFDDEGRRFANLPAGNGPPGYDSVRWQWFMMWKGHYYKAVLEHRLVGGIVLYQRAPQHYQLVRIYVHPSAQGQGIGRRAMEFIEQRYPQVSLWTLNTPIWATRNHHFYEAFGYTRVGTGFEKGHPIELIYFEKRAVRDESSLLNKAA